MVKIALLIPTTSNKRSFNTLEDSPLISILLKTFLKYRDSNYEYTFYVGYDMDDNYYINIHDDIINTFNENNINIVYKKIDNYTKSPVYIWNELFKMAYIDNCDYFYQIGDDIEILNYWTKDFIDYLISVNNIGVVGAIDINNTTLLTHSFVSRKHMEIFGYYYPSEFKNWYCDNWIQDSYKKVNRLKIHDTIFVKNVGGEPRYDIDEDIVHMLPDLINIAVRKIKKHISS